MHQCIPVGLDAEYRATKFHTHLKELCALHKAWPICNCASNILFVADTQIKDRYDAAHSTL